MKRIGVAFILSGFIGIAFGFASASDKFPEYELLLNLLTLFFLALACFGAAILSLKARPGIRQKAKTIYLSVSLILVACGTYSKFMHWPFGSFESVVGVLLFCFAYAPLELMRKYQKWVSYSENRFQTLLLSSMDFIGVNLVLIGVLARVLHLPGPKILMIAGAAILLLSLAFWNSRFKKEVVKRRTAEDKIQEQYELIQIEKSRSEELLLNILPVEIANELKEKGTADARNYDTVTILFTDFKDFTGITANMSGQQVIAELNICYEAFDAICEKFGIEKIKTIGDSYMAVGGLSSISNESPKNTVSAALNMQRFLSGRREDRGNTPCLLSEMRAGIHTGPVVAGIVGVKKFQYDIWGDTVNIASRMESNGQAGKVNISRSTFDVLQHEPEFTFESRGKIKVKGKGEIEMWFVETAEICKAV